MEQKERFSLITSLITVYILLFLLICLFYNIVVPLVPSVPLGIIKPYGI